MPRLCASFRIFKTRGIHEHVFHSLLRVYESIGILKKQEKLTIKNTTLDGRGFVFQHLQVAQKPSLTQVSIYLDKLYPRFFNARALD